MPDNNPEVMTLWRGESAIRMFLKFGERGINADERHDLEQLLPELERIRLLRVARWNQRKRAKEAKRRAAAANDRRMTLGARALLQQADRRARSLGIE